jgi:hypothetical protein
MKNPKKTNVAIFILLFILKGSVVFAWNDKVTHPNLTKSAIEKLRGTGWLEPYFQNTLGFKKMLVKP